MRAVGALMGNAVGGASMRDTAVGASMRDTAVREAVVTGLRRLAGLGDGVAVVLAGMAKEEKAATVAREELAVAEAAAAYAAQLRGLGQSQERAR